MNPRRNYPLLLAGQFLGAFGDNFLLAAILGPLTFAVREGRITGQEVNTQNALFSAVFFVPFIVLAPLAGFVNDRLPKTTWLAGGNLLKILGTLIGLTGVVLWPGHTGADFPWQLGGYAIVGIGACLYSPAKYGILPEIVPHARLVKANGTVEMLTLVAIVTGLGAGAMVYDRFRALAPCYLASLGWYLLALLCNGLMSRTPCDVGVAFRASVTGFAVQLWRLLRHPRLGRILLGCGVFWFAGATMRNNLQAWGVQVFREAGVATEQINNQNLALLKVGMVAGIVGGSLLAGQLHRVGDLGWVRRYGALMAVAVLGLGLLGGVSGLVLVVGLLVAAGLFAGLMLVPLNAALQAETDHTRLGRTIATQNLIDYLSMLAGVAFLGLLVKLGADPHGVFVALALALLVLAWFLRLRGPAEAPAVPVPPPAAGPCPPPVGEAR